MCHKVHKNVSGVVPGCTSKNSDRTKTLPQNEQNCTKAENFIKPEYQIDQGG